MEQRILLGSAQWRRWGSTGGGNGPQHSSKIYSVEGMGSTGGENGAQRSSRIYSVEEMGSTGGGNGAQCSAKICSVPWRWEQSEAGHRR